MPQAVNQCLNIYRSLALCSILFCRAINNPQKQQKPPLKSFQKI